MNHLDLKVEVSEVKMSKRPRTLGLGNIVLNGFTSNISNAAKEFSGTPKMSFSKVSSQPRVLLKNSPSRSSFKQLKSHSNAHCRRNLNKQVDMVGLNVQFVNFESVQDCNFSQDLLA